MACGINNIINMIIFNNLLIITSLLTVIVASKGILPPHEIIRTITTGLR